MRVEMLVEITEADFFSGVPDSLLKSLCGFLTEKYGNDSKHHVIAANEGNAVALAAGYHLATGKVPVVYMQNSGEGNIINPVVSLLNQEVYAVPMIFIVGWRGEPGVHDEPQHVFQGKVTLKLLDDMDIEYIVINEYTDDNEVRVAMKDFRNSLEQGRQVAFVIKKGALSFDGKEDYSNDYSLSREEVIRHIAKIAGDDVFVSTTGKASRELYEIRDATGQPHDKDFLTVGSMGHGSSIALGVATFAEEKKVWCIDGDGALLMHMGAMAVIGAQKPKNLIHIVINNVSHDTVGGMPTVADKIDIVAIAKACGYPNTVCVETMESLDEALLSARRCKELTLIEVKCALGARANLGRPATTPVENKKMFMKSLTKDIEDGNY